MALSSTTANPGTGGDSFATDTIAATGKLMMVTKLHLGADTIDGGAISLTNRLPTKSYNEGGFATYSASTTGFTPVATPTDFLEIIAPASASLIAIITRLEITGYATAASAALVLKLIKRSTRNVTAATAVALTAAPHNSGDAAASAVVNTVTVANYTTLGASVGQISGRRLFMNAVGAPAAYTQPLVWDFTNRNEKGIQLIGAASPLESLCLNWNGAAVPGGTVLDINVTWIERAAITG